MTSPTNAIGKPSSFNSAICFSTSVIPSREFLYIAFAWRGISGLDHASWAGDRSSVLVSPGTFKTVTVKRSSISGRLVNHSASAHDCKTRCACSLPLLARSDTS